MVKGKASMDTFRKAKENKAGKEQQSITASNKELREIAIRTCKWIKDQNQRPGAGNKGSRYTSNKTHYSPTDSDARISVKPSKIRRLNYYSQLSVDTANHVITDIKVYHADGKDNQYLSDIVDRLQQRLWYSSGFQLENVLTVVGRTILIWNKKGLQVIFHQTALTKNVLIDLPM